PEYTGTLSRVIVKDPSLRTTEAIRQRLAAEGLTISDPLGFDNTYALAVLETRAARLGLRTIGDLARHGELTAAFSSGFLEREDGWPGLRRRYGLRLSDVRVVEHALADLDRKGIPEVATGFLGTERAAAAETRGIRSELAALTLDHLYLVVVTLAVAVAAGLPLGVLAARFRRLGQLELGTIAMLQTVPALALLVFMIPLFGIGRVPALVALSLYALLPIVRNTYAGMISLDRQLLEIAEVLGLGPLRRLARIELPLASVSIMAGIKTSTVMTVGTATLAAFIGGGGYGTRIVGGPALGGVGPTRAGAVPAAAMALLFHAGFELVDRIAIPRGLRRHTGTGPSEDRS